MKNLSIQTIRNFSLSVAADVRLLSAGVAFAGNGHHKSNKPNILPAISVALALFSGTVLSSPAQVVVEPSGATVAGQTIGAWSAAWWQWAAALAPPGDPFTDNTGAFANVNQSGPVFLLAGSPSGANSRSFNVPANTFVLVPLLVGEYSQLELGFDKTEAQIKQAAKNQADQIDSLHATFDGTTMPQATLFTHREVSPDFNFVAVANNQVGIFAVGNSGIAVADGYFLMLNPMTPGTHVLNYGGGATPFGIFIDETDTITVTAPLILTSPNRSAGQFSFGMTGPPGWTVIIETSTNLSNWQAVGTNVLNGGTNYFTTAVQDGRQFFRANRAP